MRDYKCTTVVSFDYLHHGRLSTRCIGIDYSKVHSPLTNEVIIDDICSNYPTVTKESILFMVRIDNPDVIASDVEAYFECVKCRALVDKDFNFGEVIIVNQSLFDQYILNSRAMEGKRV